MSCSGVDCGRGSRREPSEKARAARFVTVQVLRQRHSSGKTKEPAHYLVYDNPLSHTLARLHLSHRRHDEAIRDGAEAFF